MGKEKYIPKRIETSLPPETSPGEAEISSILPVEQEDYFNDINQNHFSGPENAAGSFFTDPEIKSLEDLIRRAQEQRGSLEGDDKEQYVKDGVPEEALIPICRYLRVEGVKGMVGIVKATDLSPDTKVRVVKTKKDAPCSLVVGGKDFPEVDFATIIIGPNEKQRPEDPEPSTKEMVWTAHPGLPVRPVTEDHWPKESVITVKEVIDRLGENIYLKLQSE